MKYGELLQELFKLSPEQLECTITVEAGPFGLDSGDCVAAEFRICDIEHGVLNNGHPVIYIPN